MFMICAPAPAQTGTGYTFRGIIIIPSSHYDENFEVLLTTKDGEQIIAFTNADISSRYSFTNLSAGYFDIVIRLHGFKESRTHVRAGFESLLAPSGSTSTIYDVNIILTPDDSQEALANEQTAYTKALLDEYSKGLEEMSRKHPDLALPHLEKVVKEIPDFYDGHFNLGLVYQDLSRRDEAAAEFRKAHELNPNSARPFLVLGRLFLEEADIAILSASNADTGIKLKAAREALAEAVMRDPRLATAYYYLGAVDFRSQSYVDAERELKHALELDPMLFEARITLINVFVNQKQWQAALDNADTFLLEFPTSPYRPQVAATRQSIARRLLPPQ
jgi:tetratricopeptide (TPR) repeat protein